VTGPARRGDGAVADIDLRVRNEVYGRIAREARAPRVDELARELEVTEQDAAAALRRLHDAHALVLEEGEPPRVRMANPFSAVPTAHRVGARGRWWYANCAWDAFGVLAALGADGTVASSCPDCAEQIELEVEDARVRHAGAHVVHLLVPASRWWDDIVFT